MAIEIVLFRVLKFFVSPVFAFAPSRTKSLLLASLKDAKNTTNNMALIVGDDFQHILRVLNTNVDGREKVR